MSCWWSTTCKMQCSDEEKQRDVRSTPCAGVCSEAQILRGTGVLDLPALRLRSPRCHCPRRGARDSSPLWGQSYYATNVALRLPVPGAGTPSRSGKSRYTVPKLFNGCHSLLSYFGTLREYPASRARASSVILANNEQQGLYTRYRCDAFLLTLHIQFGCSFAPQGTSRQTKLTHVLRAAEGTNSTKASSHGSARYANAPASVSARC